MNRKTVIEFPSTDSIQDQAAMWVSKLDTDNPSRKTVVEFKAWVKQSLQHRQAFEKHMALWNDMNVLTRMVPPSQKVPPSQNQQATATKPEPLFARYWQQGLAFCLLFVFVAVVQFNQGANATYTTAIGEQQTVQLDDGTVVILNTDTKVKVAYTDQRRAIYLSYGEAHFEVAHNPDIPFEVFAGQGKVRAVGTAFTVYLKSDDVEVVVTEGTVEILPTDTEKPEPPTQANAPQATQILAQATTSPEQITAGNIATYDRHTAEHVMQTALGENKDKLSWHKGLLVFRNEPLEKVIAEVNRYTELKVVIPDQSIRSMKVGGFFKVSDINSVFVALEEGFDIHAVAVSEGLIYLVHNKE